MIVIYLFVFIKVKSLVFVENLISDFLLFDKVISKYYFSFFVLELFFRLYLNMIIKVKGK